MPAQLYDDGFHNVCSIDKAPTAIEIMKEEYKDRKVGCRIDSLVHHCFDRDQC